MIRNSQTPGILGECLNVQSLAEAITERDVDTSPIDERLLGRGMLNQPPREQLLSEDEVLAGLRLFFHNDEWLLMTEDQVKTIRKGEL